MRQRRTGSWHLQEPDLHAYAGGGLAGPLLWSVPHATMPPAAWIWRMFSCASGVISFIHAVHMRDWNSARVSVLSLLRSSTESDAAYSG